MAKQRKSSLPGPLGLGAGGVRRLVEIQVARLRAGGREGFTWALRITIAAVASYVVGQALFPGTRPLLAPLTAMLVVQVTPVSLLASGIDRVISVIVGVSLAVMFATLVPLSWWSLGLLIAISLLIGLVLRLRSNLLEVPISGMLVLGVGSFNVESAAWERIAETLVGAAVGVAANLLFPRKVATADAGKAIDDLADSVSALLVRAADALEDSPSGSDLTRTASTWLDDARQITHDIPAVGAVLLQAEQSRKLNVRAVGTPDVGPGLRQGLEALEHSAVAVRGLFRALSDATYDDEWSEETAAEVLPGLAQTLRQLAAGVDAFGALVRDEAVPQGRSPAPDTDLLRSALEGLHEARARHDELVYVAGPATMVELNAAFLTTVKRLQREMDLDQRVRRQLRLLRGSRPRRPLTSRLHGPADPDAPARPTQVTSDAETEVIRRVPREP